MPHLMFIEILLQVLNSREEPSEQVEQCQLFDTTNSLFIFYYLIKHSVSIP